MIWDDERTFTREQHRDDCYLSKSSLEATDTCDAPSRKYRIISDTTVSWGFLRDQPISNTRTRNFIQLKKIDAFPEFVWPYSYEEISFGYEEDVPFVRDDFSVWVKKDLETILRRHIADVTRIYAAFRETSGRKHSILRRL